MGSEQVFLNSALRHNIENQMLLILQRDGKLRGVDVALPETEEEGYWPIISATGAE